MKHKYGSVDNVEKRKGSKLLTLEELQIAVNHGRAVIVPNSMSRAARSRYWSASWEFNQTGPTILEDIQMGLYIYKNDFMVRVGATD